MRVEQKEARAESSGLRGADRRVELDEAEELMRLLTQQQ